MRWAVFSYSISRPSRSSPRVALWRRLQRVGAVSPLNGIYVLPARPECLEAFQWLAKEIRAAKGEALVMQVDHFEGTADAELVGLFNQAREKEYRELRRELVSVAKLKDTAEFRDGLEKARRRYADIARVDYFGCVEGANVGQHLAQLAERLVPPSQVPAVARVNTGDYRGKTWVTRPRPYVDRLACAWLIRRFIDPQATLRYSLSPRADEVAFDMEEGGQFGHVGNLCTFETMLLAFGLEDGGLGAIAEIVHEIDLNDGRYARPAATGVDSVLDGWHQARLSDGELENRGTALFEGLYLHFARRAAGPVKLPGRAGRKKNKGVKP